jgi:hypothetical protein
MCGNFIGCRSFDTNFSKPGVADAIPAKSLYFKMYCNFNPVSKLIFFAVSLKL